ncbi:MAG TPA: CoA pyrophosphatase [Thermomicrobiales bacterium]|nr:CoA pyrophosphatase [Thermomicrobiales bacterium]
MKTPTSIQAAVLVPVYRGDGDEPHLVFIHRAPGGPHGGQIAFPGGVREPGDLTLRDTALREAHEEIGLHPELVEIVEELEPVDTRATGFTITPYLARIERPEVWRPQPGEVAAVLEVRVADLLAPGVHGSRMAQFPGWPAPRRIDFYRIGPHELWGATYRIVTPLLPRLANGELPEPY